MAAKTEYRCTVLFEDEVRAAAKALGHFFDSKVDEVSPEEAVSILEACYVALQGAEDENAVLLLGRKPSAAPVDGEAHD